MFDEQSWEERYRAHPRMWSGRPNAALVAPVEDLPPGTALDAGCGEGGDALWLAGRGWRVTAMDFATAALERGRERAAALGVADRITWTHADLTRWTPGDDRYDLVSAMFVHLPGASMTSLVPRLADAVAPGGTLVVAGHDRSDEHLAAHRPDVPGMFFTADELAALLDASSWDVVAESRPRPPGGHEPTDLPVHDVVVVARRRG
ncbi:class I SAM-dependent methyltransferase [Blastococcus sp. PRF04-17]|uniref:class I SAM-dependent methyltransferase n=1 Tax=Blastococcus sp. PRF04-17 TaxID=2933797 RepID=UPI001FF5296B|nr:class I SAM-dependent methyltransferase [Blastococcus sp. PRF04-17]UOY03160.1 methyltransferase domain-containing protein [Blastococcus sp. PRF04-17]